MIEVDQVETSCGWGVPHMTFDRPRETLSTSRRRHDEAGRFARSAVRTTSIDGLPVRDPTIAPAAS